MKDEKMMWKAKKLMKMQKIAVQESMAVSLFAMVLIFGLGFIFPSINPYVVIKWIVYATGLYFIWAVPGNWVRRAILMMMWKNMKSEGMSAKKVSKRSK